MSDLIVIQPQVTQLTVTEDVNQVVVSSVGVQGAKGDTGATGAKGDTGDTGAQGASGVVTVNAPLTNAGTSSAANLSISAGTTSAAGALQLTDSVASTSTATAATANAVKTAYDLTVAKSQLVQFRSGLYYANILSGLNATTVAHETTYYIPLIVQNQFTADQLVIRGQTALSNGVVRLGIYNNNNGVPSTLLLDAGTVTVSLATVVGVTINQILPIGIYWLAFCQQGTAPSTPSYSGTGASNTGTYHANFMGKTAPNSAGMQAYTQSSVTGAFTTAGTLAVSTIAPNVWTRCA
jgi:hypothetical protein